MGESSHKTHLERHEEHIETILNHLDELPLERIEHMEDKIEGLEQIRHDDEIVLARVRISTLEMIIEDIQCDDSYPYPGLLWFSYHPVFSNLCTQSDNSLWITPRPLRSEPVPEEPNEIAPKRTSTSAPPPMTQAAIKKLVADSVVAALEVQAATMANTDNTTRKLSLGT
ncbi:hypothetical protein Tco_0343660 [Tanacetum coccineum]